MREPAFAAIEITATCAIMVPEKANLWNVGLVMSLVCGRDRGRGMHGSRCCGDGGMRGSRLWRTRASVRGYSYIQLHSSRRTQNRARACVCPSAFTQRTKWQAARHFIMSEARRFMHRHAWMMVVRFPALRPVPTPLAVVPEEAGLGFCFRR